MRVVNLLFALTKGGLEQVCFDYGQALALAGHEVHLVCDPRMPYREQLEKAGHTLHWLPNHGPLDVLCAAKLAKLLRSLNPDAIIAHGNRSLDMCRWARVLGLPRAIPVLAVAQNYKLRRFGGADGAFASTRELKSILAGGALPENRIWHVPNMVAMPKDAISRPRKNDIPVIGSIGRFVTKKGYTSFIEALALLKQRQLNFRAILAGDGDEGDMLRELAVKRGLDDILTFPGWVTSKGDFYNHIDIFCLPSLHEPFGIVLLEAMGYQLPVVSTQTEGPRDFLEHEKDALLFPIGDVAAMADALEHMLRDPAKAQKIAKRGYDKTSKEFTIHAGSQRLDQALRELKGDTRG